jgi:subtilase family serine protease
VHYHFDAPGGVFNAAANGTYTFAIPARAVTDAVGNPIGGGTLGQFTLAVPSAAADLVPTISAKVPAGVSVGYKGSADIQIANQGARRAAGVFNVTLAISSDTAFADATTILVTTRARVNLAPGKEQDVKVNFKLPASVPQGDYHLVAEIDSGGAVAETNLVNNDAVGPAFHVSQSAVDLQAKSVTAMVSKKKLSATLQLANNGSGSANGNVTVTAALAHVGHSPTSTPLGSIVRKISLKSGQAGLLKFAFPMPAGTVSGSYSLVLTVTPDASLGDSDAGDKQFVQAVTVP